MSREPSHGSLGPSAMPPAGGQRSGGQLAPRRVRTQEGTDRHGALGNQVGTQADMSDAEVSATGLKNDAERANGGAAVADDQASLAAAASGAAGGAAESLRPSLDGGVPALQRELGAHGRETVRRLLEAGLAEFEEAGFQAARVEDIVRRAKTSHGTFYLYFANKDDLFRTLLRDALVDMANVTDEFPVVTSNEAGRTALRRWVESFSETYAAHATVIRILSQADIVGESVFSDGLQLLFRLSEAMTQGMTAARTSPAGEGVLTEHAELTAFACLMMLERINYLLSAVEVTLPKDEMFDRLAAIIYAAFRS
jgi:AcrR family transcriptional regulator